MNICFTGDLFLGGDLLNKSLKKTINSKRFTNADKRIVNLEQPISNNKFVEDKCTLYTSSYAVKQLEELRVNAVNLAHNHIQDKGLEGINETINHLSEGGIRTFGAGENIERAKLPFALNEKTLVLGYCDYGRIYLNQIEVAEKNKAGVNPLRYENIIDDLNKLNDGEKAILYFHWGREHVSLPRYEDIELAKKILKDERVLLILGMHCHRLQGYVEYKGKRAYMSLGNFLFPNFYIMPPTQVFYPKDEVPKDCLTTRQYHSVYNITYKKWRKVNRKSLLINFDIKNNKVLCTPVMQRDNEPVIDELKGYKKCCVDIKLAVLTNIYRLPKLIYNPLEKVNSFLAYLLWRGQIRFFHLRQLGIVKFLSKAKGRVGFGKRG